MKSGTSAHPFEINCGHPQAHKGDPTLGHLHFTQRGNNQFPHKTDRALTFQISFAAIRKRTGVEKATRLSDRSTRACPSGTRSDEYTSRAAGRRARAQSVVHVAPSDCSLPAPILACRAGAGFGCRQR